MNPAPEKRHSTSVMLEGCYEFPKVKGLKMKAQLAFDAGTLMGNNYGLLVGVSYDGLIRFKRNKR